MYVIYCMVIYGYATVHSCSDLNEIQEITPPAKRPNVNSQRQLQPPKQKHDN